MKSKAKTMTILLMVLILSACILTPTTSLAATGKKITVTAGNAAISKGKISLTATGKSQLTVKYNNKNVTTKVSYQSSRTAVATVSKKGKITARKAGTSVITIKYKSNTYKLKLTVTKPKISVKADGAKVTKLSMTLGSKKQLKLVLGYKNSGASKVTSTTIKASKITWKSSKASVVSVSKNGKITAKKAGNATIKMTYGSVSKSIKVTVIKSCKHKWVVQYKKVDYYPYGTVWSACPSGCTEEKTYYSTKMGMYYSDTNTYAVIPAYTSDLPTILNVQYLTYTLNPDQFTGEYRSSAYPSGNTIGPFNTFLYIRHTTADTPYKCNCGETFADFQSFLTHLTKAPEKRVSDKNGKYYLHYSVPNGNVNFYCDCGESFCTVLDFLLHALNTKSDQTVVGAIVSHNMGINETTTATSGVYYYGTVSGHYARNISCKDYTLEPDGYKCSKCGATKN